MRVNQVRDGSFVITNISYVELEDLISAYDSHSFFFVSPDDLYDDQDPMAPIRKALANAQLPFG